MEENHTSHLVIIGLLALFAAIAFGIYYIPSVRQLVIDILIDREQQEATVSNSLPR